MSKSLSLNPVYMTAQTKSQARRIRFHIVPLEERIRNYNKHTAKYIGGTP